MHTKLARMTLRSQNLNTRNYKITYSFIKLIKKYAPPPEKHILYSDKNGGVENKFFIYFYKTCNVLNVEIEHLCVAFVLKANIGNVA